MPGLQRSDIFKIPKWLNSWRLLAWSCRKESRKEITIYIWSAIISILWFAAKKQSWAFWVWVLQTLRKFSEMKGRVNYICAHCSASHGYIYRKVSLMLLHLARDLMNGDIASMHWRRRRVFLYFSVLVVQPTLTQFTLMGTKSCIVIIKFQGT